MDVKISPLTDSNSKVLQSHQTESRINDQGVVSGTRDYDVEEAPVITLIRLMEIGKNVNIKV